MVFVYRIKFSKQRKLILAGKMDRPWKAEGARWMICITIIERILAPQLVSLVRFIACHLFQKLIFVVRIRRHRRSPWKKYVKFLKIVTTSLKSGRRNSRKNNKSYKDKRRHLNFCTISSISRFNKLIGFIGYSFDSVKIIPCVCVILIFDCISSIIVIRIMLYGITLNWINSCRFFK